MRIRQHYVHTLLGYLSGAFLGGVLYFWMYSWSYFLGQAQFFDPPGGDVAQALVGANYFLADSWHWLPLKVPHIQYPDGMSIVYTDSIPLFAMVVRAVLGAGSGPLNYLGVWLLLCFLLQGVGAVYLLRSFGERRPIVLALGCALFLMNSVFIFRQLGHFALCGQFLLLFALGLAVRVIRDGIWLPRVTAFVALMAATTLIHPYLAAMVGCCCAGAALSVWRSHGRFGAAALGLGAAFCATVIVALVTGFTDAAGTRSGFGLYSLNLLAPFWPQKSGIFGADLPILDATGGQYEGYSYLGAGILGLGILALVALGMKWREYAPTLHKGWPLILAMVAAYLFAASNIGYVGHIRLYKFPAPDIVQIFRSSARFVWLPVYGLTAAAIVVIARQLPSRLLYFALLAAVVLQLIDLEPLRRWIAQDASNSRPWSIDRPAWDLVLAAHSNLKVLPNYWCGMRSFEQQFAELAYLASRHNLPINTVRSAQEGATASKCTSDLLSLEELQLARGELVVTPTAAVSPFLLADLVRSHPECRAFKGGYACTLAWSTLSDPVVQNAFKSGELPQLPPGVARGETISFAADGHSRDMQLYGWSNPERLGTWSIGSQASLVIPIDTAHPPQTASFKLNCYGATQRVRIKLGNRASSDIELRGEPRSITLPLLPEDVSGGTLRVTFDTPDARSPTADGTADPRVLGVYLWSISLE
jgi:hypothetical protein